MVIAPVLVGHHSGLRLPWWEIPTLWVPSIQRLAVPTRIVGDAIVKGRGALEHIRIEARLSLSSTCEIGGVEGTIANPELVVPLMVSGNSNAKRYDGATGVSLLRGTAH